MLSYYQQCFQGDCLSVRFGNDCQLWFERHPFQLMLSIVLINISISSSCFGKAKIFSFPFLEEIWFLSHVMVEFASLIEAICATLCNWHFDWKALHSYGNRIGHTHYWKHKLDASCHIPILLRICIAVDVKSGNAILEIQITVNALSRSMESSNNLWKFIFCQLMHLLMWSTFVFWAHNDKR